MHMQTVKVTVEEHNTNVKPIGGGIYVPEDDSKPMTMGSSSSVTKKGGLWVSTPNDIKLGLLALVKCAINQPLFFAESLHATMEVSNAS